MRQYARFSVRLFALRRFAHALDMHASSLQAFVYTWYVVDT